MWDCIPSNRGKYRESKDIWILLDGTDFDLGIVKAIYNVFLTFFVVIFFSLLLAI